MFDQDEKKIQRVLQGLADKQLRIVSRSDCPDEEHLANYLSGLLSNEAKQFLETHLAGCTNCVDEIIAAHRATQDIATETVPQRVMDRAMGLVPAKQKSEGVFDVVVRMVKDSLELVRTTGEWIAPLTAAPVGVRGRAQPGDTSILQVEKQMGDFKVGIEVERVESGICQVAVSVVGQGGTPANNLRVSLLSGGREQASYLTKNGEAVFERIPQGAYDLQISDSNVLVGVVRLAME
jgi:hypothetical protein